MNDAKRQELKAKQREYEKFSFWKKLVTPEIIDPAARPDTPYRKDLYRF